MRILIRLLIALIVLFASAYFFLPLGEIASAIQFKFSPNTAKLSHFIRLKKSEQTVYLLGTTHDSQFESAGYPYWQIRAVLEALRPDLLLTEIRPESIQNGLWGEGPPEMPLAMAWAGELKLTANGMDYWRPQKNSAEDFEYREDQMAKNILSESRSSHVTLVLTGFSHVVGLQKRLVTSGYQVDDTFESSMKKELFEARADKTIPNAYFEAVAKVAALATEGRSDYTKEWADRRHKLLATLRPQSRADR